MKRIIYLATFTIALATGSQHAQAQIQESSPYIISGDPNGVIEPPPDHSVMDPTKPHRIVDQMPQFKGSLLAFIARNLKYPVEKDTPKGQIRPVIQFVVTQKGMIRDIEVVRSSGLTKYDKEAMRVFEPMKKKAFWTPGQQGGKKVAVFFTIPVVFDFTK
jgi:protein TonB